MKKNFIFSCVLFLTVISCTFQREDLSQADKHRDASYDNRSAKDGDEKDALNHKVILCKQQLIEDGLKSKANFNGYPEIEISTYYSMISNNQRWLFDELNLDVSTYFNEKYYTSSEVVIPFAVPGDDSGIPSSWTNFSYDYESSDYITRGENDNYSLDTMISPAQGSYIQYRILSSADLYVNHVFHYFSKRIRPIAIIYFKEKTLCGDYRGLGFRIFYKEY